MFPGANPNQARVARRDTVVPAGVLSSGLGVDEFAPRLSFFFVARTTLLEEVAKFRAARRLWARIMREEFEVCDAFREVYGVYKPPDAF
jgi:hypothetical protein